MGIMIEMGHEAWVRHPEGKIVLMDGRELECYAVENDEATTADGAMVEAMAPIEGAMGFKRLLSLFRSKNEELSYERLQEDLFVDNAFYLWGHKDKILGDSRMFLCPVRMSNNLAYTGTIGLRDATLGVYVEWWMTCAGATMTDGKGRRSLVYHIAGSPLSGGNHCSAIREDGKRQTVTLLPFCDHWVPFMQINKRYETVRGKCQAYELQDVLDILRQVDGI